MSKRSIRNYSTIEEWNSAFFPVDTSKMRLANLEGNPVALAEILAEEALRHATAQLTGIPKGKMRAVNLHK